MQFMPTGTQQHDVTRWREFDPEFRSRWTEVERQVRNEVENNLAHLLQEKKFAFDAITLASITFLR